MGIKRRTTLRAKSIKKISPTSKIEEKKNKIVNKILDKTIDNDINSSVLNKPNDPNQPGISKSSIRRRKRKLRDQLRPKLTSDLFDALTSATNAKITKDKDNNIEEIIIEEREKLDHRPNPKNIRGEKLIEKEENKRFKNVLKDEEFRLKGLKGLKEAILLNVNNY